MAKKTKKKQLKNIILANAIIIFLIIAALTIFILRLLPDKEEQFQGNPTKFDVNGKTYALTDYASSATPWLLEKGLMNTEVNDTTFMLFDFGKPGMNAFWMKNTYSPLDIIWMDYDASTHLAEVNFLVNATPCVEYDPGQANCKIYWPNAAGNYVLEAKAGFAEKNQITIGTKIKFTQ
jgi:uncharacterized protein